MKEGLVIWAETLTAEALVTTVVEAECLSPVLASRLHCFLVEVRPLWEPPVSDAERAVFTQAVCFSL